MATYVLMLKEFENEDKVVFRFGPDENRMGRIEINKKTKEYNEIESVPKTNTKFYFNCAVSKLLRYLIDNEGQEFPERIFYAS